MCNLFIIFKVIRNLDCFRFSASIAVFVKLLDFIRYNLYSCIIIYIYSILGQKVLEKEVSNQSSNVSLKSLENGIYFYKIEDNGFFKSGKIIKQ